MNITPLKKSFYLEGMDEPRYPIVQGGMGVGISLSELSRAVDLTGGVGTISSALLDKIVSKRLGKKVNQVQATRLEVLATRFGPEVYSLEPELLGFLIESPSSFAAINIMRALDSTWDDSIQGAVLGGVNAIVSGAGLPLDLPARVAKYAGKNHKINLIPIVSSGRALEVICKKWERQGHLPDAVVLEGPKAGGHIGWKYDEVQMARENFLEEYELFSKLLPGVLEVAHKYKTTNQDIPVIVAGGIYTNEDILFALSQGASAVQLGTRFAATDESGATKNFKRILIEAKKEDIVLGTPQFGSPCKLPFRYIRGSPLVKWTQKNRPNHGEEYSFCICSALSASAGISRDTKAKCPEGYLPHTAEKPCPAKGNASYLELVSTGTEGYRVDRVMPVKDLMRELIG